MRKVVITPRSYGKFNKEVFSLWEKENFKVIREIGPVPEERMIELIKDADALIIGTDFLSEKALEHAKNLKIISKYGVGIDNIPRAFALSNGIEVMNTPGVNTEAVADYTFSLLLAVARHIPQSHENLMMGRWQKMIGQEVFGKTIGILGFGAIGQAVAKRAKGFNMNILAYDVMPNYETAEQLDVKIRSFDEIIEQSDFLTLHLPLIKETKNLINYQLLKRMKKNCVIVNTARGGIVNEHDLGLALQENVIGGAAIDVFYEEPLKHSPLQGLKNVILTPHNAAATIEATERMTMQSTKNVLEFFRKEINIS
ncbi:phosphoglycerate dehydrogenase [Metabacillus litoralis]|uniref:phosphoglycerate dehydrogenase n=1 Tax=Metabacillus TaxID=2675233 RepID=UPI000EF5D109|nr:phosphoglycerate dehydrogenase [Metabacillus litoralis]MCM3161442.1 phosphoglycerate dehydrogenase [Metabacillus litoralis]